MRMRSVIIFIQHITYCAEFSSQVLLDHFLSHISIFRLFGQIQEVLPREVVFLRTCLLRVIALSVDRQYRFITELWLLISIHIYQTSFHYRRISSTSHSILGLVLLNVLLLLLIKNEFSKRLSFNSRTI